MTSGNKPLSDNRGVFDPRDRVPRRERPSLGTVREPARDIPLFATTDVLVAGRHLSTGAQTHTFMREIPQCWLTGHAAGVAAALSVQRGLAPSRSMSCGPRS